MLIKIISATLPVGIVLFSSEYMWRKKLLKGERARKYIHILAGIWMAFWPFYIPFDGIFMLGAMAFTLLLYSRLTNLLHAIYAVKRKTYGELFFALAIIVSAYLAREPWVFTVSILFLALADGGAAVVGRFWGLKNQYLVFGNKNLTKSVTGTAAFVGLAYVSVGIGLVLGGSDVFSGNVAYFVLLPLVMAAIENVSPYGLDNFATPLLATIVFNSLL